MQTGGVATRNITQYDAMGRILADNQTTDGNTYPFSYSYNLLGRVTGMKYPSGRVVNTWYDVAGRICVVGGTSCTAAGPYVGSTTYAENGALQQATLRNGLVETTTFNVRFQPTGLTAVRGSQMLGLGYGYPGGTSNNGNVVSENITTPGGLNAQQVFAYDAYNRLLVAEENPKSQASPVCPDAVSAWCQAFSYDQYGNRAVTAYGPQVNYFLNPSWTPSSGAQFTGNNQWVRGLGDAYDAAGNLASLGSNSSPGTVASTFVYDGEGRHKFTETEVNSLLDSASRKAYLAGTEWTFQEAREVGRAVVWESADGTRVLALEDGKLFTGAKQVFERLGTEGLRPID